MNPDLQRMEELLPAMREEARALRIEEGHAAREAARHERAVAAIEAFLGPAPEPTEFEKFEDLTRKLLRVPKRAPSDA